MPEKKNLIEAIDRLGWYVLGVFCLGYFALGRMFAEFRFKLSFLNFPLFVGEIGLIACVMFFFARSLLSGARFRRWHYILFLYAAFVLYKALMGYTVWGPLALRHAALFYYPAFAIFAYYFYRKEFFTPRRVIVISLLILGTLRMAAAYNAYSFVPGILIFAALLIRYPLEKARYIIAGIFLLVFPYFQFFSTSRTMLMANLAILLYLICGLSLTLKIKTFYKVALSVALVVFIIIGVLFSNSGSSRIKSLVSFGELLSLYNKYDRIVRDKENGYKMQQVDKVRLFNPKTEENIVEPAGTVVKEETVMPPLTPKKIEEAKIEAGPQPDRNLEIEFGNAIFRLFIWRDILREIWQQKKAFGLDFGKPLRPKSLEILNWDQINLERDGWVAAHNSYLEMAYRAGIVAIVFWLAIFALFLAMVKGFLSFGSSAGILLSAALLSWMASANFLVIFELPYNAVPFWSLFGVSLAYMKTLKNESAAGIS